MNTSSINQVTAFWATLRTKRSWTPFRQYCGRLWRAAWIRPSSLRWFLLSCRRIIYHMCFRSYENIFSLAIYLSLPVSHNFKSTQLFTELYNSLLRCTDCSLVQDIKLRQPQRSVHIRGISSNTNLSQSVCLYLYIVLHIPSGDLSHDIRL